ncbi:MAG: tRNA (guanosine(37)-N1)-methyltransferase TrmD [Candidatus Melainabacteria bacterium GWF2_37_15]|nr:MAG: tRNA (guanosine(37)-N1)-methyltransferase TrmD [Candidatus Melainabacteria bacterium GWF2_37_15]
MKFDIITLFPEIIDNYCSFSIPGRARKQGIITVNTTNPRDFTHDVHRKVDDTPYGGGAGMVLMCPPFYDAYESVQKVENSVTLLLTPQGQPFNQEKAVEFAQKEQLIMLCGHYEGFDERIRAIPDIIEISIGDFVLTGGELPALCIIDAVTRLLPGVLGKDESSVEESFYEGLLEYPHYTRPYDFRGMKVPDVLLSGNHKKIAEWRKEQAVLRTQQKRPDLWEKYVKEK